MRSKWTEKYCSLVLIYSGFVHSTTEGVGMPTLLAFYSSTVVLLLLTYAY